MIVISLSGMFTLGHSKQQNTCPGRDIPSEVFFSFKGKLNCSLSDSATTLNCALDDSCTVIISSSYLNTLVSLR